MPIQIDYYLSAEQDRFAELPVTTFWTFPRELSTA